MMDLCINNLDKVNFFTPKEKKALMLENLRNIFTEMNYQKRKFVFYPAYLQN